MRIQIVIGRLQEIRRDDGQGVHPGRGHRLGHAHRRSGRAGAAAGIDRYAVVDHLDDAAGELDLLVFVNDMELAVAAENEDALDAMADQMLDEIRRSLIIDALLGVAVERGDDRRDDSFEFHVISFLSSPGCSCPEILPDAI